MKFKLSTISLTAVGLLSAIATTSFANEAPVVDIQEQQENASVNTQPAPSSEQSAGGAWQVVSSGNGNNNADGNNNQNQNSGSAHVSHDTSSQQGQNNDWRPSTAGRPSPAGSVFEGSVNERVSRLEQQVTNYNHMNMPQQISDLQQKIAQLQGQLEVDQHTIKTLTDQQKLYYQDTQQQITQLQQQKSVKTASNAAAPKVAAADDSSENEFESKTSRTSTLAMHKKKSQALKTVAQKTDADATTADDSSSATATASKSKDLVEGQNLLAKNGTTLSDADLYDKAFHSLSNKDFKGAQTGFQDYLSNYPKGRFAVSAHFWLGEIGLMHEKYDAALKQFQIVVSQYPSSNKVSDAKLKIAMIHAATGKMDVAREEFAQIRKTYPGTTAAQLASIRLQQLANATSVSVQ